MEAAHGSPDGSQVRNTAPALSMSELSLETDQVVFEWRKFVIPYREIEQNQIIILHQNLDETLRVEVEHYLG